MSERKETALDDFDIQVLRACAGLSNTLNGWGAAVGEAASALKHRGLLEGHYRITETGRALLLAHTGGTES